MSLKRGSGPTGLGGMRSILKIKKINKIILRPFLLQSRTQIKQWAHIHHLSWINDESNYSIHLDRNFLRIKILPILIKKWPQFYQTVARSAKLCADQVNLLYELLTNTLNILIRSDGSLRIDELYKYSEIYQMEILRGWLSNHNSIMPSYKQIKCICREVICSRKDSVACFKIEKYEIRRFRQSLYYIYPLSSLEDITIHWSFPWRSLILPSQLGTIDFHETNGIKVRAPLGEELNNITIRFKCCEKFYLLARDGSRDIKKIWQELNVPPWMRNRIPLIFYGHKLITAGGLFITQDGAPIQKTTTWYFQWNKN